jgi:hypothetical protein
MEKNKLLLAELPQEDPNTLYALSVSSAPRAFQKLAY